MLFTINFSTYPQSSTYQSAIRALLWKQSATMLATKPEGIKYRVKAQTWDNDNPYVVDSQTFIYSGSRVSLFDYNSLSFLYPENFSGLLEPLSQDVPRPLGVLADSIFSYTAQGPLNVTTAVYEDGDKVSYSSFSFIPPNDVRQWAVRYNSLGYINALYYIEGPMSQGDTILKREITYVGNTEKIATDSFFDKGPNGYISSKFIRYYYNSNGKPDSILIFYITPTGLISLSEKQFFTYYPNGNLWTSGDNAISGPENWIFRDSFAYIQGIIYTTFHESSRRIITSNADVKTSYKAITYPGANGLPDSVTHYYKNNQSPTWSRNPTALFTYTAFGAPDYIELRSVYGSSSRRNKFYYDIYEDNKIAKDNITIAPNPFPGYILINNYGNVSLSAELAVIDILGRRINSRTIVLRSGSNQVDLQYLACGMYIITLKESRNSKEFLWIGKMVRL